MTVAVAEKLSQPRPKRPRRVPDLSAQAAGTTAAPAESLIEEARLGVERLARMSHDELRREIAKRVDMLENVLKEREERRLAIEEALAAQRLLDARRDRARRIRRRVNVGSSLVAATFTGLVVAAIF